MLASWSTHALAALARGEPAVLVTVCAAEGSTPRGPGTKMVVTAHDQHGTIGGGNLEFTAAAQARGLIERGGPGAFLFQDYPLGPLLQQCCGGYVRLLLERLDAASRPWLEAVEAAARAGEPTALISAIGPDRLDKYVLKAEAAADWPDLPVSDAIVAPMIGRRAVGLLDRQGAVLAGPGTRPTDCAFVVETLVRARPVLALFGAGHTGHAVARIVGTLGFDVTWIDDRAEAFPPVLADNVRTLATDDPASQVPAMPPGALYLVFTHSHRMDYEVTAAILKRGDARYCGLIGSKTKRARFERRFRDDGLGQDRIDRLTCPIGAGGPTGKAPEVIAIAVAAELLKVVEASAEAATGVAIDSGHRAHGR